MAQTLRIGIVGSGGMGRTHFVNWKAIPDAEVTALCGSSQKSADVALDWGVAHYGSITEMVQSEQVDVVDICTPTFLHHDLVMESLELGMNTICEKPIALSCADAREMLDAAEQNGCHLYIAQVLQFTKEMAALRQLVASEEYGKVLDASFERLSAAPRWASRGWLFEKEKSGLLPYDLHIHDLDMIVSLFGKPDRFTVTSCKGRGKSYAEHIRILYHYADKTVCGEAAWFNAAFPWTARWRVYFEKAVVVNDGRTVTAYAFDAPPRIFDTKDEVEISTGVNVPPCGWFYNQLSHFAQCIRQNIDSPYVSPAQLMAVMEILEQVSNA